MAPFSPLAITTAALLLLFTAAHTSAQDCFDSTFAILMAQATDPRSDEDPKKYTICPNHTINIGIPDQTLTNPFLNYVNGDFPLTVIRPNVEIECEGCKLNGGWYQLATFPDVELSGVVFSQPVDNMKIKGITFTGQLNLFLNTFPPAAIRLGRQGTSIQIEDVTIENLQQEAGNVVGVASLGPPAAPIPDRSIEVSFNGLYANNVNIGRGWSFVGNFGHTVTITKSRIQNLEAGAILNCGGSASKCTVEETCFENTSSFAFLNEQFGGSLTTVDVFRKNVTSDKCNSEGVRVVFSDGNETCRTLDEVDCCALDDCSMSPSVAPSFEPSEVPSPAPSKTPCQLLIPLFDWIPVVSDVVNDVLCAIFGDDGFLDSIIFWN